MDSPGARFTEISVLVSGFVLRASATLGVATDNMPTANTPVNAIEINFLFIIILLLDTMFLLIKLLVH